MALSPQQVLPGRYSWIPLSLRMAGLVCGLAVAAAGLWAEDRATAPRHLRDAERLVHDLQLEDTSYVHGEPHVTWKAKDTSPKAIAHTDCSGFIDALLMHTYGYERAHFKKWLGKNRPTADSYHDAIVAENRFQLIKRFDQTEAGDLLAVKYLTQRENTGHIMLAAGSPRAIDAKQPRVDGTRQWEISVIDCSKSGHGPHDTRHHRGANGKDHDGLGQGVLRVYTHANGEIAGWSWSSQAASEFRGPHEEHLVVGRLKPGLE